jgi:hypothetical protein
MDRAEVYMAPGRMRAGIDFSLLRFIFLPLLLLMVAELTIRIYWPGSGFRPAEINTSLARASGNKAILARDLLVDSVSQ